MAMIEYKEGFGEPGSFDDIFERFVNLMDVGFPVEALHVGTPEELQRKKEVGERLHELEDRMARMESEPEPDTFLYKPTRAEMKVVTGETSNKEDEVVEALLKKIK